MRCQDENLNMKALVFISFIFLLFAACKKQKGQSSANRCDIDHVQIENAKKLTVTSGVWGTVCNVEGDCMPTVPANSGCRICPTMRTIKIYEYTTLNEAITSDPAKVFFDSLPSTFIVQTQADANGFFEAQLEPGKYTLVIVENGRMYANTRDGYGGINPFTVDEGVVTLNPSITYKATF